MTAGSFLRMANVNGEITPLKDARISVLDRGFLYGDSVYEVFRTYSGVPLFCHEHFDRMENSARLIHMRARRVRSCPSWPCGWKRASGTNSRRAVAQ